MEHGMRCFSHILTPSHTALNQWVRQWYCFFRILSYHSFSVRPWCDIPQYQTHFWFARTHSRLWSSGDCGDGGRQQVRARRGKGHTFWWRRRSKVISDFFLRFSLANHSANLIVFTIWTSSNMSWMRSLFPFSFTPFDCFLFFLLSLPFFLLTIPISRPWDYMEPFPIWCLTMSTTQVTFSLFFLSNSVFLLKITLVGLLWVNAAETWVDLNKMENKEKIASHWISETGNLDFFLLLGPSPAQTMKQVSEENETCKEWESESECGWHNFIC